MFNVHKVEWSYVTDELTSRDRMTSGTLNVREWTIRHHVAGMEFV